MTLVTGHSDKLEGIAFMADTNQPPTEKRKMLTPENTGVSQLACNIVNNTFLSLDGFEALRKQMDGPTSSYDSLAFAASLARIVENEIKQSTIQSIADRFNINDPTLKMTNEELAS